MEFKIPEWRLYLLFIWVILGIIFVDYLNNPLRLIFIIGIIGGTVWVVFRRWNKKCKFL